MNMLRSEPVLVPSQPKTLVDDKMAQLHQVLSEIHQSNQQVNQRLSNQLTCENPKVLEVLMEHIVLHWDDIVQMLLDELIHEEVQELNQIEWRKVDHDKATGSASQGGHNLQSTSLADRSMYGKFHDYKSVDLRDIMSLFDDYMDIEQSVISKAHILS